MTTETYAITPESYNSIQTFATIDYCDSIGDYEWDEFRVLRGVDGLLYVHAASGCSCFGWAQWSRAAPSRRLSQSGPNWPA